MRIALAGLGNVGAGVVRLLQINGDLLQARCGQKLTLSAVSARNKDKNRDCDLAGIEWVEDPRALATRNDVDVVVEVIGGGQGVAFDLATASLASGKHFVTANKVMIAAHGVELAAAAEKAGLHLSFEAAVCGGVPVLKMLREGLAGNRLSSVRGILNGTSNYILSRMGEEGLDFATVLADAQRLGYAEADPTDDIDGFDAANKLAILAALAFGVAPNVASISVEGIRAVTPEHLREAAACGGRIKLLGIAEKTATGITQKVRPVFVPLTEALARVDGVTNGIEMRGDFVGDIFIQGAGAGGNATASAIVADLVDIACGRHNSAFGISATSLG